MNPEHLIVRYLSNEATPAEQEQLFDWVSQNPENKKVFDEYVNLWSVRQSPLRQFNVQSALSRLNERINEFETQEKRKTAFWNVWNLAAAVALLLASGFTLYFYGISAFEDHALSLLQETSAASRPAVVTLADGSIITLNKHSSLKYPSAFDSKTREVLLSGEAFFQVAKDSLRPFAIRVNGTTTTVLGTSFNIRASADSVTISVATGKVRVSDGSQAHILEPFEKLLYTNETFVKSTTDLSELNWNVRVLEFNDIPLGRAAELISEFYEVPVTFTDEKLKKCFITGKFKNQKLETVLQAVEFSTDVHSKVENNTILFFGKGGQ